MELASPQTFAAAAEQPSSAAARPGGRLPLLDELRGLMIVNVVAYHTLYDLVYLFGVGIPWFHTLGAYFWQQWMSGSLVLLAGVSCRFSRSNARRGLRVLGLGMALSLGTWLAMPGQFIAFGILHFMGSAMLLFALLRPRLDKVPRRAGLWVCLALFVLTKGIYYGRVGIPYLLELDLPRWLYSTPFLFPLGLPGEEFLSADYFPLLPWLFLFLAGSFEGVKARAGQVPEFCRRPHLPALGLAGRHTMAIYLAHQPLIFAFLFVLFRIIM